MPNKFDHDAWEDARDERVGVREMPTLDELLEMARNHKWTEAEKREHMISFAWGNVHLHNPSITRADIERAYDELHGGDITTSDFSNPTAAQPAESEADGSRVDRLHEAAIPVAAIDPRRAAVVAHIATLGHAAAYDWLVDRVVELEDVLRTMLASAHPHPVEHPTMTAAWEIARAALSPEPDGGAR